MRKLLLFAVFLYGLSLQAFAQPANDNCSTAQSLGTLPTPSACPTGNGSAVNVSGTNVGATSPNPYSYMIGCQPSGTQAAPALDVWYSFVASGTMVNIIMSGTLATPNVALWTGTCTNLTGFGCAVGSNTGSLTTTFQPLTPGQTYYIQVSGNTSTSTGNFTLSVDNDNDCNNCLESTSFSATPPPLNGTYLAGQTVTFCYTVSNYIQVSSNWLHGVQVTLGSGWDTATVVATPPASCAGTGTWGWYSSVSSSASGVVYGPGFFYDYNGFMNSAGDGDPGNNYGDSCNTYNWVFCLTVTTDTVCIQGASLDVSFNSLADGESGSWTSIACQGDPSYNFNAFSECGTSGITDPFAYSTLFTVYPNPANEFLNIYIAADNVSDAYVTIYTMFGQEMMRKRIEVNTNEQIAADNLPSGMYYCRIALNNNTQLTRKFIIQH